MATSADGGWRGGASGSRDLAEAVCEHLWILLCVLLSLLTYGYLFGSNPNQDQILPFVHKINNPVLYPDDPYVRTLPAFPSLFPYLIAFLSQFAPLAALHLGSYLLLKYFLLWVAFRLAQHIFSDRRTGGLACFLFALSPLSNVVSLFGDDPLFKTALFQTSFAGPFALWAVWLFLQGRYVPSFLIVGALYYFNGLIANFLVVMFAAASLPALRSTARGWAALGLLGLPWLFWVALQPDLSGGASDSFVQTLRLWYPGHYFPSGWWLEKWTFLTVHLAYFIVYFHSGFKHARCSGTLAAFIAGLLAMWSLAFLFGEFIPLRQVIVLQFFRSDVFFISLGLIFAADFIRRTVSSGSLEGWALGGLLLLVALEFTPPGYAFPVLFLLLLSTLPFRLAFKAFVVGVLCLCFMDLFTHPFMMKKLMVVALLLSLLLVSRPGLTFPGAVRAGAPWLVLPLVVLPYSGLYRYRIAQRDLAGRSAVVKDWVLLQAWAKDHTATDDLFVVPPNMNGFRDFSERSPFVEWIDGAAMHWSPGSEKEWTRRLAELGFADSETLGTLLMGVSQADKLPLHRRQAERRYAGLREERFLRLGKRYGADFAVQKSPGTLAFPVVHRNRSFTLYKIPNP